MTGLASGSVWLKRNIGLNKRACFPILKELRDQLFPIINSFFVLASIKHFGFGGTRYFSKCSHTHLSKARPEVAQGESASTKLTVTQEE